MINIENIEIEIRELQKLISNLRLTPLQRTEINRRLDIILNKVKGKENET